jgi:hypothetical protein
VRVSALPFLLIYLLCLSKRDGPSRRIRCASSPTRPPPALQNSASGLLVRWLWKPLPISRGAQRPPCDFFRAVIPAPMTRVSSWSYSQNPAQARGDSDGRVSPIVPLILLGSTSEIPFLRSVSVAEHARGVREGSASNPFPGCSINWMIAFPRLRDYLLVWAGTQARPVAKASEPCIPCREPRGIEHKTRRPPGIASS